MSKLSDWEIGQDICAISDFIGDRLAEIKESKPEAYAMLDEVQRTIGDYFNRHHFKSHGFGLKSHDEFGPAPSGGKEKG